MGSGLTLEVPEIKIPLGLLETSVELALERPEYGPELRAWLADLAKRIDL